MSWSFSGQGRPPAVAARMRENLTRKRCHEPEETIKLGVMDVVAASLSAFPETHPVRLEMAGSQSAAPPDKFVSQLVVKLEPLWGFLDE